MNRSVMSLGLLAFSEDSEEDVEVRFERFWVRKTRKAPRRPCRRHEVRVRHSAELS